MPILSVNYETVDFRCRAIIGRAYPTPLLAITGVSALLGGETRITTAVPHGLSPLDTVSITGITMPSSMNGQWIVQQVINATEFNITFTFGGSWTLDGQVQLVYGQQELVYSDNDLDDEVFLGAVSGDAVPLFADASVRRINPGTGRNWKSRISLAPIGETSQTQGKFNSTFQTAFDGWAAFMILPVLNAVTTLDRNKMMLSAMSRKIAFSQPTPFTDSELWCKEVSALVVQPNLGSMTRRKPRLTSTIAT